MKGDKTLSSGELRVLRSVERCWKYVQGIRGNQGKYE